MLLGTEPWPVHFSPNQSTSSSIQFQPDQSIHQCQMLPALQLTYSRRLIKWKADRVPCLPPQSHKSFTFLCLSFLHSLYHRPPPQPLPKTHPYLQFHLLGRASSLPALLLPFPQSPCIASGQANTNQPPANTLMHQWKFGHLNAYSHQNDCNSKTKISLYITEQYTKSLLNQCSYCTVKAWTWCKNNIKKGEKVRMNLCEELEEWYHRFMFIKRAWKHMKDKLQRVSCPPFKLYRTPGSGKGQEGLPWTLQTQLTICSKKTLQEDERHHHHHPNDCSLSLHCCSLYCQANSMTF